MSPSQAPSPALVWYGDDFTGATDTLGTAARAGLHALLFLKTPDAALLARAGALDVVGIAGAARAMSPEEMRAELQPVAALFRSIGARVLHYKTCSTFDSAPQIGSIGAAIAVLRHAVETPWTAIVGGQPNLGRYCLFGHLFAAAGSGGEVHRLDRHPTMSRHPVTPMHESDLRRHLAAQGVARVASVPYTAASGPARLQAALDGALGTAPDAVLFDVSAAAELEAIGAVLWAQAEVATLLAVGPSSVVQALAAFTGRGTSKPGATASPPARRVEPATGPVLVMAGSMSPVSAQQVAAAQAFDRLTLDADALAHADATALDRYADALAGPLAAGRHLLVTLPGAVLAGDADGRDLARAGGALLARVLARVPLRRVGIAGGDTSSHAVQALDAWGLSYEADIGAGAALCRLHSDVPSLDGMEIMLKGGQMGTADVFDRLVHGAD